MIRSEARHFCPLHLYKPVVMHVLYSVQKNAEICKHPEVITLALSHHLQKKLQKKV